MLTALLTLSTGDFSLLCFTPVTVSASPPNLGQLGHTLQEHLYDAAGPPPYSSNVTLADVHVRMLGGTGAAPLPIPPPLPVPSSHPILMNVSPAVTLLWSACPVPPSPAYPCPNVSRPPPPAPHRRHPSPTLLFPRMHPLHLRLFELKSLFSLSSFLAFLSRLSLSVYLHSLSLSTRCRHLLHAACPEGRARRVLSLTHSLTHSLSPSLSLTLSFSHYLVTFRVTFRVPYICSHSLTPTGMHSRLSLGLVCSLSLSYIVPPPHSLLSPPL